MRRKFVCLVLLGLLVVGLFPVVFVGASGESWLDGWGFRKSHSLTGSSGAGADYQVMVTVDYGSGSDSGDTVYVDGECETDFDDIRFTDDDGDTLLDYWLEDKTDSDSAVFWVEVADDLGSNQLIYVYYGNDSVSSLSDGDDTFLFYEPFDNLDAWTRDASGGSGTVTDGVFNIHTTGASWEVWRCAGSEVSVGSAMRFSVKSDDIYMNTFGFEDRAGDGSYIGSGIDNARLRTLVSTGAPRWENTREGSNTYDQSRTSCAGAFHVVDINWYSTGVDYYVDGSKDTTETDDVPLDDMGCFGGCYGANNDIWLDWVVIRSFVVSEPSHGVWGSEEEPDGDSYPQYQDVGDDGESEVGASVGVFCNWTDDLSLDTCYFSTNTSGVWVNSSLSVSGVQSWANTSFILNYTAGILVQYKWYCCDNATQWNVTSAYSITTVGLDYGEGGGDVFQFKPWFGFVGAIGFLSVCVFFGVIVIYKKR